MESLPRFSRYALRWQMGPCVRTHGDVGRRHRHGTVEQISRVVPLVMAVEKLKIPHVLNGTRSVRTEGPYPCVLLWDQHHFNKTRQKLGQLLKIVEKTAAALLPDLHTQ